MRKPVDRESIEAFLRSHERVEEPRLLAEGRSVGEWMIRAFLGKGGSGEVYRAEHRFLRIPVAIKVLYRDDSSIRGRFLREAEIFATARNPAFPRFYSYGEIDGFPYLVIELLEQYPLPCRDGEVARYVLKVCEGVDWLHRHGFVHRDIKPQNVLRRPGTDQPVLIDLGLVKDVTLPVAHRGESLSIVNGKAVGVGTPKYAAPEQFAGGEIAPTADIHALGMLANECFEGAPPSAWARIIRRSTSSIPSQRYASVSRFAKAVRHRHRMNRLILLLILSVVGVAVSGYFARSAFEPVWTSRHAEPTSDTTASNVVPVVSHDTGTVKTVASPRLSRGVRFIPDSDSGGETSSSGPEKWPRQGVYSGDSIVDPNF